MDSLFVSFNGGMSVANFTELSACVFSWLEEHCKPQVKTRFYEVTLSKLSFTNQKVIVIFQIVFKRFFETWCWAFCSNLKAKLEMGLRKNTTLSPSSVVLRITHGCLTPSRKSINCTYSSFLLLYNSQCNMYTYIHYY